jgi:hypothetical protein
MENRAEYYAIIRKDGNTWAADLYKEGKVFYRSWLYLFRTKKALVNEINSMRVEIKA